MPGLVCEILSTKPNYIDCHSRETQNICLTFCTMFDQRGRRCIHVIQMFVFAGYARQFQVGDMSEADNLTTMYESTLFDLHTSFACKPRHIL